MLGGAACASTLRCTLRQPPQREPTQETYLKYAVVTLRCCTADARQCLRASHARIASTLAYHVPCNHLTCAHRTSQHARSRRSNTGTHARARARAREPRPRTGLAGQAVTNTHIAHVEEPLVSAPQKYMQAHQRTRAPKDTRAVTAAAHLNSARGCQQHEHNTLLLYTQAAPLASKSQPHCCRHPQASQPFASGPQCAQFGGAGTESPLVPALAVNKKYVS